MKVIEIINFIIAALFFICYSYQFVYIPVAWFKKNKPHKETKEHNFAVLISARNENAVIGYLIDSLKNQTYNPDLITVFVTADNCTDNTAEIAREHGAIVFERFNKEKVGKGYALDEMIEKMEVTYLANRSKALI